MESTGSSSIAAPSRESTNASASSTTTPPSTSTASIPTSAALFLVRHRVTVPLVLRGRTYADTDLLVMAIINRTPDSFYDKGATYGDAPALAAVARAVQDGADIVDVGGVKAGPGGEVSEAEEIDRVVPFVRAVRDEHADLVISVDTWRSGVANACLDAGADIVNDAWGGVDADVAVVAGRYRAAIVCTHAGGQAPRTRPHRVGYDDVMADVITRTTALAQHAIDAGVPRESVLLDPGHDFGKNTYHSLEVTRRLPELVALGFPVLVSLSNKDFVGETLDRPVPERLVGTLATTAIAASLGAQVFRAHNVRETRDVLDMVASIRGDRPPAVARRGLA
jgi:dihydropteroate synthase